MAACLFLMAPVQTSAAGETAAQGEQRAALQSRVYPIQLPPGTNVPLSAEYFEMRLGLEPGEIAAITITSLPQEGSGKLMLDGVEVQVHDTIFRSELDRLCYVQDDNALSASAGWFSFIPLCSSEILGEEPAERVCATFQLKAAGDDRSAPHRAGCVLPHQDRHPGLGGPLLPAGGGCVHGQPQTGAGERPF